MKHLSDRTGSAFIGALIIAILVGGIVGIYLESVRQEIKNTHHTRLLLEAVNVAEIGAEDALYAIYNGDWTGWDAGVEGYSRRISHVSGDDIAFSVGDANEVRYVDVFVRTSDPNAPVIVTEGCIEHPLGISLKRQLRIDLSSGGMFMNGLTARDQVEMNGNNVSVDSYHSSDGDYDPATNRRDKGSVASVSVEVASIDLQNADILGYVATGGAVPKVGKKGSITGFDTPAGTRIDTDRITTDFYSEFPPVSPPTVGLGAETSVPSGAGTHILGMSEYHLTDLNVASTQTYNVVGNVVLVVDGEIDIKGEIKVTFGSTLEIYAGDDVTIGGNGIVNNEPGSVPANLLIYGTAADGAGQLMKLHGNGALQGAVYAPFADVEMKGSGVSGTMFGAVVANNILLNGNYEFHYDEALADMGGEDRFSMDGWRELELASHRYGNVLALKDGGL